MSIDGSIENVKLALSFWCLSVFVFPALKMHLVIMNFQEGPHFVDVDPFEDLHRFLPFELFFVAHAFILLSIIAHIHITRAKRLHHESNDKRIMGDRLCCSSLYCYDKKKRGTIDVVSCLSSF